VFGLAGYPLTDWIGTWRHFGAYGRRGQLLDIEMGRPLTGDFGFADYTFRGGAGLISPVNEGAGAASIAFSTAFGIFGLACRIGEGGGRWLCMRIWQHV
jgi:hypothetical protein